MLACLVLWTSTVLLYNRPHSFTLLPPFISSILPATLHVPLAAITTFTGFTTFLLTYRTNQSLSRLLEARLAWGRTVLLARDLSQLLAAHLTVKAPLLALTAARHLSLFGLLLKSRLRDEPDGEVIAAMLGKEDAFVVESSRKHPVAVVLKLHQVRLLLFEIVIIIFLTTFLYNNLLLLSLSPSPPPPGRRSRLPPWPHKRRHPAVAGVDAPRAEQSVRHDGAD